MRRIGALALVMFAGLMNAVLLATPAAAAQHLWFISQIYSDADGTVQFIEFIGRNNGQNVFNGTTHALTSFEKSNQLIFTRLASSQTLGAHFLVATQGFVDMVKAMDPNSTFVPDFIVPNRFLEPTGDGVTFLARTRGDEVLNIVFPLDGRSVSRQLTPATETNITGMDAGPLLGPDGMPVPNLARNFAGQSFVVPDGDMDGVVDAFDNCLTIANTGQPDSGGVAGPADPDALIADGIGDACQCGDVSNDGRVTAADATLITDALAGRPPFTSVRDLPGFLKCDVGGTTECSDEDATLISNSVLGVEPGITNACTALPTPAPGM